LISPVLHIRTTGTRRRSAVEFEAIHNHQNIQATGHPTAAVRGE